MRILVEAGKASGADFPGDSGFPLGVQFTSKHQISIALAELFLNYFHSGSSLYTNRGHPSFIDNGA
ncbi:MAG: hypothetical protein IH600_06455 [Bacteroidetes bacterium]|nr:hypothetical protein [Bacteroidota bacterium]